VEGANLESLASEEAGRELGAGVEEILRRLGGSCRALFRLAADCAHLRQAIRSASGSALISIPARAMC
jgi:hypothetical protein